MYKKKIIEWVRKIIAKYEIGQELDLADSCLIYNLLCFHPNARKKLGKGVKSLWVMRAPAGTKHFYIKRIDGTGTDFSWRRCLHPATQWREFNDTCRHRVEKQIIAFKREKFGNSPMSICDDCKLMIHFNDAEVDHAYPYTFAWIVNQWISINQSDISKIEIAGDEDNSTTTRFVKEEINQNFQQFHKEKARLRLLCKQCHKEATRKSNKGIMEVSL